MELIQLSVMKHITSVEGRKKTNPKTCTQTPREEIKSAGVYFLSHSIQNESIFSVFLVLYIATINRREQKRNI